MFKIKQTASLSDVYFLDTSKLRSIRWLIIVFLSVLSFSISIAFKVLFFQIFILFIGLMIIFYIGRKIKGWAQQIEPLLIVRENLLFMLRRNSFLFTATKDGAILRSAKFNYQLNDVSIVIHALKSGDEFTKEMDNLDVLLSSALGISLSSKEVYATHVEYVFVYRQPERLHVTSLPLEDDSLKIKIYDDFVIDLRKNFSMLISGASGAGKSFFTYYYLTRFISQTVNGRHAKIYVIDPKFSDIYKLSKLSGLPVENYGTTNEDSFRIVRHYINEMNRRMEIYNKSDLFDSIGIDLGLPPLLLVIEEYSSLVASMDSKAKKDFENMVAIVAQKARSLSMGVCIVMQQPRSDSLSTNIREQLVNAIFLGAPTRESSQMMFGTTDVPKVKKDKGVGLYSTDREPPKEFHSPMFDRDVFEVILPVWEWGAKDYMKDEDEDV
ncbi:putative conjugative element protein [Streptococcus pneumoniae]|uniref:FtsK/SpoIIIE domain-containing protein n=1 Tax=Streptococcus pneumoniae TaxID=1313 RepID=UPI0005EA5778|nr:FtsK/SpoIIIE domain-containing protein [Streptococcus pneumoniae]CTK97234.1 putative conjugative element protein [Streptococcus pneumoniae]CTL45081.1 putative conjugative element protein [Streptococcus pneumoniae]CTL46046.1 putative conjugative element protein [Streptococcus pneumoniae]CTL49858.1 putative conjugative element protein [Streptococcus pneumoniae]CTL52182.1 putative conjugative element protein [Streptococcus pneumoniae]